MVKIRQSSQVSSHAGRGATTVAAQGHVTNEVRTMGPVTAPAPEAARAALATATTDSDVRAYATCATCL
ncbi:hypothetical protein OG352_25745 [Streptomyces sp. NBC_01485]|uniref:hypothetical protein n=1 Tax=Streptomyces sp. NBC_01485 TaxID=2903884 RepID=UPI002E303235|nr:hypothetical protein [Streptomyces sp. NBC_01485]